jgi:hypothetical protein
LKQSIQNQINERPGGVDQRSSHQSLAQKMVVRVRIPTRHEEKFVAKYFEMSK